MRRLVAGVCIAKVAFVAAININVHLSVLRQGATPREPVHTEIFLQCSTRYPTIGAQFTINFGGIVWQSLSWRKVMAGWHARVGLSAVGVLSLLCIAAFAEPPPVAG
jgi:hypothetical protein